VVVSGQEAEGEVTQVLVKFNGMPREVPQLDSLVELQGCELRDAWRNATGAIPEGQVIAGLSPRELALNLLQGKRKREAPQCLGHWQIDRWGIYFGKWVCEFSEGYLGLGTGVWEDLRVRIMYVNARGLYALQRVMRVWGSGASLGLVLFNSVPSCG
jgi:hypothetical protein